DGYSYYRPVPPEMIVGDGLKFAKIPGAEGWAWIARAQGFLGGVLYYPESDVLVPQISQANQVMAFKRDGTERWHLDDWFRWPPVDSLDEAHWTLYTAILGIGN